MRTSNYELWDYEGESGSPELDDMHERPLQETISVFKEARLEPEVQHGQKHVKVLATARPAH